MDDGTIEALLLALLHEPGVAGALVATTATNNASSVHVGAVDVGAATGTAGASAVVDRERAGVVGLQAVAVAVVKRAPGGWSDGNKVW